MVADWTGAFSESAWLRTHALVKLQRQRDCHVEQARVSSDDWCGCVKGHFPERDTGDDHFAGIAPVAQFPANGYGLYDVGHARRVVLVHGSVLLALHGRDPRQGRGRNRNESPRSPHGRVKHLL